MSLPSNIRAKLADKMRQHLLEQVETALDIGRFDEFFDMCDPDADCDLLNDEICVVREQFQAALKKVKVK